MIKVFISHSSKDVALAKELIDLLRSALPLSPEEIRCTSVPGYKLPGGARSEEQLRQELLEAPVFIGLLTKASLGSTYVLFELGARWGAAKQLIPLLAPGIPATSLEGPISSINALVCGSSSDLHALVEQVSKTLGIEPEPASAYQSEVEILTAFPLVRQDASAASRGSEVPQSAVDQLAELRSEAIHDVLNRQVTSDAEVEALAADTAAWWGKVKSVLERHFSKAEELNFTRLGAVPNMTFPHTFNATHAKILREYALQERRLLDIIARHTR